MNDEAVPLRNVYARSLVWSMFRGSADEDYLAARWAARTGSPYLFFWHAQQSIEKYLKGGLLLNGVSTANLNHNISEILVHVRRFAEDLLPLILCPPGYWELDRRLARSPFEPLADFVERINVGGHPDNRYRHGGYLHFGNDLHKLDEACFQFRRLVFPLDGEYSVFPTYREFIKMQPNHQPHLPFEFLRTGNNSQKLLKLETITWKNFSFFETEARQEGKINAGVSMGMSELELNVRDQNRTSEAVEWLVTMARFTNAERANLRQLIKGRD